MKKPTIYLFLFSFFLLKIPAQKQLDTLKVELLQLKNYEKFEFPIKRKGKVSYGILGQSILSKIKIPKEYRNKKLIAIEYFFNEDKLVSCDEDTFSTMELKVQIYHTQEDSIGQGLDIHIPFVVPPEMKIRKMVDLRLEDIYLIDSEYFIGFSTENDNVKRGKPFKVNGKREKISAYCNSHVSMYRSDQISYLIEERNFKIQQIPIIHKKSGYYGLKMNLYFEK